MEGKNEGQLIFDRESGRKKRRINVKVTVNFKRLIFYLIISVAIYLLLSYSYRLILAYQDFYVLVETYSSKAQNNILVTYPPSGDTVSLPLVSKGKVRTFGNDLVLQVRNHSNGEILFKEKLEVRNVEGKQFGDFIGIAETISTPLEEKQNIILEFYLESGNGVKSSLVTVPLILVR